VQLLAPLHQVANQWIYQEVYRDSTFTPLTTITRPCLSPNEEQRIMNTRFASLREDIEHKVAQVFGSHQVLHASWRPQLFFNGKHVQKLFFVCLFMSNCHCCFNESQNRRFNVRAPTLVLHLPLAEILDAPTAIQCDLSIEMNLFR
jgi:hypothetical protein